MGAVLDIEACRGQFPALQRRAAGHPAVYFDGPAGSQVPRRVIDAVSEYFSAHNANRGGVFATSVESDALLADAGRAVADLLGSSDPDLVVFGPNMTTLAFELSRALSETWGPGDEVLVTRAEHDANFTPWVLAAHARGATVRCVEIHRDDCTIDLDDLRGKLSSRTRLAAIGCASNAVGTIQPVREIVDRVHDAGGQIFLDAVHHAPHALMDVEAWDCEYVVFSMYKVFGPHLGVLWGKRRWLNALPAPKVRPAPDALPWRWMTGTQSHEAIAGSLAAVEYLADLGRDGSGEPVERRRALARAYEAIAAHERRLVACMLSGLAAFPRVTVHGITDGARLAERAPTVGFTYEGRTPREVAEHLASRGVFVWHGNFYALPLTEALGLEPDGLVRAGLLHYNTEEEVDRFLEALAEID